MACEGKKLTAFCLCCSIRNDRISAKISVRCEQPDPGSITVYFLRDNPYKSRRESLFGCGKYEYKEVNEHDGAYYRRWASVYGDPMVTLIDRILRGVKHEEQAYNSCKGILHIYRVEAGMIKKER